MAIIIQLRRGTASKWTSTNPVLALGELGFETDTLKTKVGDGVTTWTNLGYTTIPLSLIKSDSDIADAISKKHSNSLDHSHSNKSTLDGYNQTNSDLSSAVSLKHSNSLDHAAHSDDQDLSGKIDKVAGKTLSTNDLTDVLKSGYDSAVSQSHAAHSDDQILPTELSDLTDDATHRLTTDIEKSTWNGKSNLALGNLSSNAYPGDTGKTAYDHSQTAHAPSNAQKNSDIIQSEIEAKLTGVISTHSHASGGLTQAQILKLRI